MYSKLVVKIALVLIIAFTAQAQADTDLNVKQTQTVIAERRLRGPSQSESFINGLWRMLGGLKKVNLPACKIGCAAMLAHPNACDECQVRSCNSNFNRRLDEIEQEDNDALRELQKIGGVCAEGCVYAHHGFFFRQFLNTKNGGCKPGCIVKRNSCGGGGGSPPIPVADSPSNTVKLVNDKKGQIVVSWKKSSFSSNKITICRTGGGQSRACDTVQTNKEKFKSKPVGTGKTYTYRLCPQGSTSNCFSRSLKTTK